MLSPATSPLSLSQAIPDVQEDPLDWWIATDAITDHNYDPKNPLPYHPFRKRSDEFFSTTLTEDLIVDIICDRRVSATTQLVHSQNYLRLLTSEDFESVWVALGRREQERLYLKAFQCEEKHNLPIWSGSDYPGKANIPELRRDSLNRDNGRGFIELMKMFVLPDNNKVPAQPFVVENERFDKIIGFRKDEASKAKLVLLSFLRSIRSLYIQGFISNVVSFCYHGKEAECNTLTAEHFTTKPFLKANAKIFRSTMGKEGARQFQKATMKRVNSQKLHCQMCLKIEDKANEEKMAVCSRCKAFGRETRYCGRVCQREDWNRHKKECGKPLDPSAAMEDVFVKGSEAAKNRKGRPDIPACPPGHRRLPHLVKQIQHLENRPSTDYICQVDGGQYMCLALEETHSVAVFIHMRNILFTTTESPRAEQALLFVYRILMAVSTDDLIISQLKREYGEPLWNRMVAYMRKPSSKNKDGYFELDRISRTEIDLVLGWLKGIDRFTEELVAWRPGQGKIQLVCAKAHEDVLGQAEFPADAVAPPSLLYPPTSTRPVTGERAVGPNFRIPKPRDREDYRHSDHCNIADQIKWLQTTPNADYMIWGHPSAPPNEPMAFTIHDLETCSNFNTYRYQLFRDGPYNTEALVYIIMTLRSWLTGKKFPEDVLMNQLRKEYSATYVDFARSRISRRAEDGKEIWTSHRTGMQHTIEEIPLVRKDSDFWTVVYWLKETGRFG